jgi:hypothetical protein
VETSRSLAGEDGIARHRLRSCSRILPEHHRAVTPQLSFRSVEPIVFPCSSHRQLGCTPKEKTRKIRLEIEKLISLGCDRVALLGLIANPPADGINMGAWHNASVMALKTESAMAEVLSNRLPPDCTAGHWVYSVGAVAGGDETVRGSGLPQQYREAQPFNPSTSNAQRSDLNGAITDILSRVSPPYFLPAVYMNCRVCKRIHHARSESCPLTMKRFSTAPRLE